jgi:hypothetical protein
MSQHDSRGPGSFDPRTWEAIPRYDASNPPDKNRPRPVIHTAGIADAHGLQRCVRCGYALPAASPPHAPGTVITIGEGKSYDSVICVAPVPTVPGAQSRK